MTQFQSDVTCWKNLVAQRGDKQIKSEVGAGLIYWAKLHHWSLGATTPSAYTLFSVRLTTLHFIGDSRVGFCVFEREERWDF